MREVFTISKNGDPAVTLESIKATNGILVTATGGETDRFSFSIVKRETDAPAFVREDYIELFSYPLLNGTVRVTNGSTALSGTGTAFAVLTPGRRLRIAGVVVVIDSITNDTLIVLTAAWAGSTDSGLSAGLEGRRFCGIARTPRLKIEPNSRQHIYTFDSPSKWLKSPYRQYIYTRDGELTPAVTECSDVVLGMSFAFGDGIPTFGNITALAQAGAILDYAQATGKADGAAPFDYDSTGIPDERDRRSKLRSITCWEALKNVTQTFPALTQRWDYYGDPGANPTLRFVKMNTLNIATGDPIYPPTLTGSGSPVTHTISNDGTLMELAPVPRDDLLYRKLRLVMIEAPSEPRQVEAIEELLDGIRKPNKAGLIRVSYVVESVVENGSPLTDDIVFELGGYVFDAISNSWSNPEPHPDGQRLLRYLHEYFSMELVDCPFTLRPGSFHWEMRPTDLCRITGAGDQLASQFSVIQEITRNLAEFTCSVRSGPPAHRGLDTAKPHGVARKNDAPNPPTGGSITYGYQPPEPRDPDPDLYPDEPDISTAPPGEPGDASITVTNDTVSGVPVRKLHLAVEFPSTSDSCPSVPESYQTQGSNTADDTPADYDNWTSDGCTQGLKIWLNGGDRVDDSSSEMKMIKVLLVFDKFGRLVTSGSAADAVITGTCA